MNDIYVFKCPCQTYKNMNKINLIGISCMLCMSKSCQKLDRTKIGRKRWAQKINLIIEKNKVRKRYFFFKTKNNFYLLGREGERTFAIFQKYILECV